MTRASADFENHCLSGGITVALYQSIHTGDPGTTGANEVSGAGYARNLVIWGSPSAGVVANTNTLNTTIPAGTSISFFGTSTAVTAGSYEVGGPLSAQITFVTAGTFTIAPGGLTISAS